MSLLDEKGGRGISRSEATYGSERLEEELGALA
jgi:hypothetical protein